MHRISTVLINSFPWKDLSLLFMCFVLFGCSPKHYLQLHFIHDGQTKKEEVLQKFGEPSFVFTERNIIAYRLRCDGETECLRINKAQDSQYNLLMTTFENKDITRWLEANYSMILIFDSENILKRHKLIKIK